MNLAISKEDRFLKAIQSLGMRTFTTLEAIAIGECLAISPLWVRKILSLQEKADKLVRVERGRYMTMQTYTHQKGTSS